eukprot:CAMPEP_0168374032 /NCGR_PEP_ID=MMETSP0228-20121227/9094_1 /TAXON_ID=133427 /ORGANISM="Protoceratium reticulatum, Strain CCCM 535 (=CCMP 1889)" /LENGTH=294 /DNA_ID=CAMNT_0008386971 /DNA_START=71 /DNA_END=956 /DNA_ORIENTATION=-
MSATMAQAPVYMQSMPAASSFVAAPGMGGSFVAAPTTAAPVQYTWANATPTYVGAAAVPISASTIKPMTASTIMPAPTVARSALPSAPSMIAMPTYSSPALPQQVMISAGGSTYVPANGATGVPATLSAMQAGSWTKVNDMQVSGSGAMYMPPSQPAAPAEAASTVAPAAPASTLVVPEPTPSPATTSLLKLSKKSSKKLSSKKKKAAAADRADSVSCHRANETRPAAPVSGYFRLPFLQQHWSATVHARVGAWYMGTWWWADIVLAKHKNGHQRSGSWARKAVACHSAHGGAS